MVRSPAESLALLLARPHLCKSSFLFGVRYPTANSFSGRERRVWEIRSCGISLHTPPDVSNRHSSGLGQGSSRFACVCRPRLRLNFICFFRSEAILLGRSLSSLRLLRARLPHSRLCMAGSSVRVLWYHHFTPKIFINSVNSDGPPLVDALCWIKAAKDTACCCCACTSRVN